MWGETASLRKLIAYNFWQGVGTFFKVGGGGQALTGSAASFLGQNLTYLQKPIFSSDLDHFIFAYLPEDEKKKRRKKYFWETPV